MEYPRQYLYLRIVRAKLFIDERYSSAIDLTNIAGEACFSKYHFFRVFRSIYGLTPHQYLTHVRIEKAKELLADGSPVAAVCYAVGFDSITSFTGLFKRRTGLTPARYQLAENERRRRMVHQAAAFVPNCFASEQGWKE